jgi:dephospho-CoA kinase
MKNIIGLTGGVCTGKNNINNIFLSYNMAVVDSEKVLKDVILKNSIGYSKIINYFGEKYLDSNNNIAWNKLLKYSLISKDNLDILYSIVNPLIIQESKRQINNFLKLNYDFIVFNCPYLIELNIFNEYYPIILTTCDKNVQINKIIEKYNITKEQALIKLGYELSYEDKKKHCNYIIDTSLEAEFLLNELIEVINKIKNNKKG